MEALTGSYSQIIFQAILALVLGAFIGLEREFKRKEAGLQTYSLVSLGACLFTIISIALVNFSSGPNIAIDPSRIIQAVAIGIGFIGAGVIFQRPSRIEGLTTAAGLWTTAAIGIAIGIELYFLAIFGAILAIIILFGFGYLERKFFGKD
jgi:putative Mg2+ transporter-C (MgtC) family protein